MNAFSAALLPMKVANLQLEQTEVLKVRKTNSSLVSGLPGSLLKSRIKKGSRLNRTIEKSSQDGDERGREYIFEDG